MLILSYLRARNGSRCSGREGNGDDESLAIRDPFSVNPIVRPPSSLLLSNPDVRLTQVPINLFSALQAFFLNDDLCHLYLLQL